MNYTSVLRLPPALWIVHNFKLPVTAVRDFIDLEILKI